MRPWGLLKLCFIFPLRTPFNASASFEQSFSPPPRPPPSRDTAPCKVTPVILHGVVSPDVLPTPPPASLAWSDSPAPSRPVPSPPPPPLSLSLSIYIYISVSVVSLFLSLSLSLFLSHSHTLYIYTHTYINIFSLRVSVYVFFSDERERERGRRERQKQRAVHRHTRNPPPTNSLRPQLPTYPGGAPIGMHHFCGCTSTMVNVAAPTLTTSGGFGCSTPFLSFSRIGPR